MRNITLILLALVVLVDSDTLSYAGGVGALISKNASHDIADITNANNCQIFRNQLFLEKLSVDSNGDTISKNEDLAEDGITYGHAVCVDANTQYSHIYPFVADCTHTTVAVAGEISLHGNDVASVGLYTGVNVWTLSEKPISLRAFLDICRTANATGSEEAKKLEVNNGQVEYLSLILSGISLDFLNFKDSAENFFVEAIRAPSESHCDAYGFLAKHFVEHGEYVRAFGPLQNSLKAGHCSVITESELWYYLGSADLNTRYFSNAYTAFSEAISRGHKFRAKSLLGRGIVSLNMNKKTEAHSDLKLACNLGNKTACEIIKDKNIWKNTKRTSRKNKSAT
jgi:hypothetical protein